MKLRSSDLDSIVYGTLLGDASLSKPSGKANSNFTLSHSPKQKEYLEFKKDLVNNISHVKMKYKEIDYTNKQNQKTYKTCYYYSNYLEYFTKLRKIFYLSGRKIVTRKILNKLKPLGLALWWMDDGSLVIYERKDRNAVNRYATLATCNFTYEEHEIIVKYFNEVWDIFPKIKKRTATKSDKEYYVLKFPMKEFRKFKEIIEPHIIPSMQYKIDLKYVNQK